VNGGLVQSKKKLRLPRELLKKKEPQKVNFNPEAILSASTYEEGSNLKFSLTKGSIDVLF